MSKYQEIDVGIIVSDLPSNTTNLFLTHKSDFQLIRGIRSKESPISHTRRVTTKNKRKSDYLEVNLSDKYPVRFDEVPALSHEKLSDEKSDIACWFIRWTKTKIVRLA